MAMDSAATEKLLQAEKNVAGVRFAIIAFNSLVYAFLLPHEGTIEWLAWTIIAVAWAYAIFVLTVQPYRRFNVLLSSYFTTLSDGALITLWIGATGGFDSPFYVLWYASLAAVAFRFNLAATLRAVAAYIAAYALLLVGMGEFAGNETAILVRVAYIAFVGILGGLLSREVLQQVRAKQEIRAMMRGALRELETTHGLLESAPDGVVIVDDEGQIMMVNSRTEQMFGYSRKQMLGRPVELLVPESLRPRHEELRRTYSKHPVARPMGADLELAGQRRDGSQFPVEISLSPLHTEEGTLITASIRDVTERLRLDQERQERIRQRDEIERLREQDSFKTQFINAAAHELGTPMTPIMLQVHLLRNRITEETDSAAAKSVAVLDRNIRRLQQLIQDVLDGARIQANRLGLRKEAMQLDEVIQEVVESFQAQAASAGVALTRDVRGDLGMIGDQSRITQVLFNLVSNALKFTTRGQAVTIRGRSTGATVEVSVIDDGAGMLPQRLGMLFQPFSQVHDRGTQTRPGTGLGLYISRGIVELHGGRITAESGGLGKGSTFTFVLPRKVASEEDAGSTASSLEDRISELV